MQMMKMEKRWKKEERETTSMWALRFKGDTIIQVGWDSRAVPNVL